MAHPDSLDLPSGFDPRVLADHALFVRRLARGLVRDGDAADELTSRTFAAAVERRPDTGPGFRVWLERVIWRLFLRERRDQKRRDRRERVAASPEPTRATVDLVAELDLQRRIARAFEELAEPSKSALYLRYFRDLGPGEIAEQLQVPVSTVKSRLQRGLEALRERLDALHEGRREAWLQALVPWIGGPMVATKVKVVPVAVAALLLVGLGVGGFEVLRRNAAERSAPTNATPATSPIESAAAAKGAAAPAGDATPTRESLEATGVLSFASGIVVDEAGTPLANVAVVATNVDRGPWNAGEVFSQEPLRLDRLERDRRATTDARGRFVVDEPGADLLSLVFLREGFASAEWSDLSAERAKNQDHRMVLQAGAGLRGRVVDHEHRPVDLALVRLIPTSREDPVRGARTAAHLKDAPKYTPFAGVQQTASDVDGAFAFTSAPRSESRFWVLASGYASSNSPPGTLASPCEVVLVRNALLLDVVDSDSKSPLRAALVVVDAKKGTVLDQAVPWLPKDADHSVVAPPGQLTVHTGYGENNRRTAVPWVSDAKDGRIDVQLHVMAAGHVGEIVDVTLSNDEEPPHLHVALEPADGASRDASIEGRVRGAKRAEVRAFCLIPNWSETYLEAREPLLTAVCDDDGHFDLFELPAARYRLFVRAPGVASAWVDVEAPARDVTIDLQMAAALEVAVKNRAGVAAAGVIVHAQRPDRSRAWYAKTDADGVARFEGLPAGPLVVGAFEDLRYDLVDPTVCFALTPSAFTDATVVATKPGERVRIERTLVELLPTRFHFERDDGAPIAKLVLDFMNFDGPVTARYREIERLRHLAPELDGHGDATLELDLGSYDFHVSDGGPAGEAKFDVPSADGSPITVRIPVLRDSGVIVGRVVDSVTGKPIVNRKVYATSRRDGQQPLEPELHLTDADGRFRFDRLPVGPTRVSVQAGEIGDEQRYLEPDPTSPYSSGSQECTVVKDGETEVEFSLPPLKAKDANLPTRVLDARVTDAASGRPLEGATLYVHARFGATDIEIASATTDADGRVRTPVFAAEKYSVSIYGPVDPRNKNGPEYGVHHLDCTPENGVLTVVAALAKGR
jgi:RNA polymerase sigma-70 factor (ECF subfamily)